MYVQHFLFMKSGEFLKSARMPSVQPRCPEFPEFPWEPHLIEITAAVS